MRATNLDPAEEWLAQYWLDSLDPFLGREEVAKKIKVRLYEYIYNLLETTRQYEPPYNPDLLFKDRKILKKIETQLPNNMSGVLTPILGGFIMKIRSDEPSYRRRFTIAHEIGHTFFYDIEQDTPSIRFIKSNSRYWVQEDYANEIAAAILLPEPSLRKEISDGKLSPSLYGLDDLRKLYEVSYDVLHRRIVRRLSFWDCIIFYSTMESGGTIRTDSTSVSKGKSYRSWNIPKILSASEPLENKSWNVPPVFKERLYLVLAKVFETSNDGEFLRNYWAEKLKDEGKEGATYLVQSKRLYDNNLKSSISLIVKKD